MWVLPFKHCLLRPRLPQRATSTRAIIRERHPSWRGKRDAG